MLQTSKKYKENEIASRIRLKFDANFFALGVSFHRLITMCTRKEMTIGLKNSVRDALNFVCKTIHEPCKYYRELQVNTTNILTKLKASPFLTISLCEPQIQDYYRQKKRFVL